jgi:hypothetical protein
MTILGRGDADFSTIVEFSAALLSMCVGNGFLSMKSWRTRTEVVPRRRFWGVDEKPGRDKPLAEITLEKAQAARTQRLRAEWWKWRRRRTRGQSKAQWDQVEH